jgi:hypothetical protein
MQPAKCRIFCILTFACCLSLYLLTLTDVHTYDALSYVLDVDRKPWRELFHPHHLAYGPLGAGIRAAAAWLGWAGSAEKLLQIANAAAGALGAALFGLVVRRATGREAAGLAAALLLGASYAYWYYAVEVEVYTIAAVFLIAALGLLLALAQAPSPRLAAALGVTQGCAVLFHQTNVLLAAPALIALLVGTSKALAPRPPLPPGGRGGADGPASAGKHLAVLLAAYAAPLALVVGGAYLWVGLGVSGFRSWGELYAWLMGYARTGYWGGAVDGGKLALLGQGLARTFAQPGGALVGSTLLAALLLNLRALAAAPRGVVAVALAWLAAYGAFFLWWEPDNVEFWIASLPPFYLLVALSVWGGEREGRGTLPWLWPAVVVVCGAVMLGINFVSIGRRGDAGRDLQRVAAAAVAERSAPGDLVVAPDGLPELYLPFYAGRPNVFSLSQAMTAAGGDWPAACALIQARVDEALAGGYAVLVAADAIRPPPAPPGEPPTPAERLGLAPDTVAACYAPLQPAFDAVPMGEGLPPYYRIAPAQELAEGPGWDFARSRWGWRAANADHATSPLAGWALRPLVDPSITSPPLRLDAGRFSAVELRLAADTAARDAQLFFLDTAGRVDESRSVRWELSPGLATYRIALRDLPGWTGIVTGLRFDPVGVGDGGTVVVESMRLVP